MTSSLYYNHKDIANVQPAIYIWGTNAKIFCVNIILSKSMMTYCIISSWKKSLLVKTNTLYVKKNGRERGSTFSPY